MLWKRRREIKTDETLRKPLLLTAPALNAVDRDNLTSRIAGLGPWFHNMNLAEGVWTNAASGGPGADYPSWRWDLISPILPEVQGQRCLDIGCSSGFFSLKLKELGAERVLGIDHGEQDRAMDQARFAAESLHLDVEFRPMSVYDLATVGSTFNLVLFMGVFYHLRHPMVALEAIRSVCNGTLIFQTITTPHLPSPYGPCPPARNINAGLRSRSLNDEDFPLLRFVEGGLDGDTSCWFIPSIEAVLAMLRACGFTPEMMMAPTQHEVIVRASANR